MTINFTNYTREHWALIDGWNEHGAFTALEILDDIQTDNGIRGHVCEIGVHEGQFFFALALLTNPDEFYIAIDVFEDQHRNLDNSGRANTLLFKENTAKYVGNHDRLNIHLVIIKADSLLLTPEFIGAKIVNMGTALSFEGKRQASATPKVKSYFQGIRLMSIDGGHTRAHVLNDLKLAERSIVHGGVVILDDFLHPKWPGVTEGAHVYCSDPYSRLIPFAYGNKKLYLSTDIHAPRYLQEFKNVAERVHDKKEVEIWNRQMLWVDFK